MNIEGRKSKIILIITDFGSFNNFLSELAIQMVKGNNFDVIVICSPDKVINFDDKFNYLTSGIKFYYVKIPRNFNIIEQIIFSRRINRIINSEKPEIIHAHFMTAIFTTVLCKNSSTQIWGTFHGLGSTISVGIKKLVLQVIEYFCFTRLGKIIILNRSDLQGIPGRFHNIVHIPAYHGLGCDLERFNSNKYTSEERHALRKEFKIMDHFVLAFTGRYVYFKGFDIVAKLFMLLCEKFPDTYKILLIGGKDPIHRTGLTRREESLFFKHPDVINIGFTKNVEKFLSLADLFVFPSKKEGIPVCISEALAMGIPVVTFNSRGCNDLVRNSFNGVLIESSQNRKEEIYNFFLSVVNLTLNKDNYQILKKNILEQRKELSREKFITDQINLYKGEGG
jgi:glycosyltransferase involved in cell wall biosynthesis